MVELDTTPTLIEHPYRSGLVASADDVDQMADMLLAIKAEVERLRACEYLLRNAIASMATADTKTKRVAGAIYRCKVVMPDDYWEQSTLKELWAEMPELAKVHLRIASLAPNMVEVKKLANTSGTKELEQFKSRLFSARRPSNSPPTITVEQ